MRYSIVCFGKCLRGHPVESSPMAASQQEYRAFLVVHPESDESDQGLVPLRAPRCFVLRVARFRTRSVFLVFGWTASSHRRETMLLPMKVAARVGFWTVTKTSGVTAACWWS
jgi:hypothetical protein